MAKATAATLTAPRLKALYASTYAKELQAELNCKSHRKQLAANTVFSKGLFHYRTKRTTPGDPKLDWTNAGTWAKFDHQTEVPGWKAYILNPRVTYQDVDRFIQNLEKRCAEFEELQEKKGSDD